MSKIPSINLINLYPYACVFIAGFLVVVSLIFAGRTLPRVWRQPPPPQTGAVTPQEQTLNKALELLDTLQADQANKN